MMAGSFPTQSHSGDEPDELDTLNEHVLEPGDPDGVIAAEQRQLWQERRPAPAPTPRAEPVSHTRRWLAISAAVVLMVAALFGAYLLGSHQAGKKQSSQKTQAATVAAPVTSSADANIQKSYTSTNYGLTFSYPGNWVVKDTAQKLTVTSPAERLVSAVGATVAAHVVVTIQNQQTSVAGYPSGGAAAALNSDLLTYKQPSTDQVTQTNVTYLSYIERGGLDEIYLTGSSSYQQGQAVPESDIVKGNPLISVGFMNCKSVDCSTGTSAPVVLKASDWKASAASQQVTNLIESIVIND